jgi:FtsZ-binding cell division protein ZapB
MTADERQSMKKFEAKVRQAIARFRVLQKENADLYAELENRDEEIRQLQANLAQSRSDYNNLKLAKMIEISDTDIKESKMKISRLVREINKCINILSASSEEDEGNDIAG